MTLFFVNDYGRGAHPKILEQLTQTNLESEYGYGMDSYSELAKEKIRLACEKEEAEIYFLVGGTQTNAVVIKSLLRSYEGVIAANTGHISTHEAGAIEYTGHKVIELPNYNGKLRAEDVEEYFDTFGKDANLMHMVKPGMVYISYPTEYGTLYNKEELTALHTVCKKYNVPLFVDGARLGYGLMAKECDITFKEFTDLCDVFYIGGTKVGALCGEAVVFTNKTIIPANYITIIKQAGALLAKGRLLGVQFDTLFTDNLYFNISKHAIEMAELLKKGLKDKGYKFYIDSPTNQQFIIMENRRMEKLKKTVQFAKWEKYDDSHTIIRFVVDWSTKKEDVEQLIKIL
ncbi:low specificity L-threonine aldolase [Gemella sp. ND 6198]|uniref:threonine aldolase family protein n=1 Tax=Gemella sp. ND 6198 TaxID=2040624 RepID=UPI000E0A4ECF|nr:aminotransferase class I/II-fold pyridoxal phosphate-dependent enzyme [Gemella sp. ND 6198]AXI27103.1 low specificity L-threonine aldolase [Gemella sp. ND 6198]